MIEFGYDQDRRPVTRDVSSLYRGLHTIGVPGSGKTTLLAKIAVSALTEAGMIVIDPDGSLIESVLPFIPPERAGDTLVWDPAEQRDRPWAANLWEAQDEEDLPLICEWFQAGLKTMFRDSEWGLHVDVASRVAVYALAAAGGTIYDIPRFFRDRAFRLRFYPTLQRLNLAGFEWMQDYDEAAGRKKVSREQDEKSAPLIRRIEKLTTNPTLARIFGQPGMAFDLAEIMREKKILLVRLNDADLGPGVRQILANLLIAQLFHQTLDRSPESPPFLVVVDEINSLIHEGWTSLIERARKYRVGLVLAHQHLGHLKDPDVRNALLVIPNRIAFQLSGADVRQVATSYPDEIGAALRGLPRYQAAAKLDNDLDPGFTTTLLTVTPPEGHRYNLGPAIREASSLLGRDRAEVDAELRSRDKTIYGVKESLFEWPGPDEPPWS